MKDSYNPHSDIGKPTTHEIGIPKLHSKRNKCAHFKADPDLWSTFKETCAARGVSICHVLEALMEAWIQGQKAEATLVRPVIVNLTMQHVVQRPRRVAEFVEDSYAENVAEYITRYGSCHRLEPKGLYPGRIGWCRWMQRWIQGLECSTCVHSGETH